MLIFIWVTSSVQSTEDSCISSLHKLRLWQAMPIIRNLQRNRVFLLEIAEQHALSFIERKPRSEPARTSRGEVKYEV